MKAKSTLVIVCISVAVLFLSSCGSPLVYDLNQGISATGNPIGSKVGFASGNSFLGMSFGTDVSIRAAAKNAGITKIATVDFHSSNYLGLIQAYTCTVTGE